MKTKLELKKETIEKLTSINFTGGMGASQYPVACPITSDVKTACGKPCIVPLTETCQSVDYYQDSCLACTVKHVDCNTTGVTQTQVSKCFLCYEL